MTGTAPARPAVHWLLAGVTAMLPPSRRPWGAALLAELSYLPSRREQLGLVLGAIRVALLPPPGLAGYGQAAGRASLVAGVGYVPLGLVLLWQAIARNGALPGMLVYVYLIVVLMAAGLVADRRGRAARRAAVPRGQLVVAGISAGLVLAVLGTGTVGILENALRDDLAGQAMTVCSVAALLVCAGGFFACIGALAGRGLSTARDNRPSDLR